LILSNYDSADPSGDFQILRPKLEIDGKSFLSRVEVKTDSPIHQALQEGSEVEISQSSACSVTVTFSSFQLLCRYSFPVAGNAASLRLARKSGWMEVRAPLLTSSNRHNYDRPLVPLLRDPDLKYSTWDLAYVDLNKLPKLQMSDLDLGFVKSIHVLSSFTDREFSLRQAKPDFLTNIKESIYALFMAKEILRLRTSDNEISPLLLFLADFYIELNAHSLVREVYVASLQRSLSRSIVL
jgi:hypothetical protein